MINMRKNCWNSSCYLLKDNPNDYMGVIGMVIEFAKGKYADLVS